MKRAVAPWTIEQVLEITDYQGHPDTTSYVCTHCGGALTVEPEGLACLRCGRTQTHVHGNIANGRWRVGVMTVRDQVSWLIDYWHEHNGVGRHLSVWLNMTDDEYDRFMIHRQLPDQYTPPRHWNRHP
jgi:hypothetical protein